MTVPVQLLSHLYAALLRLYPPALHAEFGTDLAARWLGEWPA